MKRIGVFGGSFNPVHKEHVNILLAAMNAFSIDEFVVMPTYVSPHKKNSDLLGAEDRLEMLKLAFEGYKRIVVSDYEIKKEGVSYTYLTLEHLKKEYGDAEIYFLVGADMLADFPNWRNPEKILAVAKLIVTQRTNEDLAGALAAFYDKFGFRPLVSPYVGKCVSGTKIRCRLLLGLDCGEFLDEKVLSYIEKRSLFDGGEYKKYADYLKKALKKKRLLHTAGVMELAVRYAKKMGVSEEKAYLAAMLHDVAKYLSYEDFGLKKPKGLPKNVVHQFLGAYVCENVLKIEDEDVLNAVRYHTTGRANMSKLEKIIFVADFLEEGRDFDGVNGLRAAVEKDFDEGFRICIKELFDFLVEENEEEEIYYLSKECKEYYCGKNI